MGEKALSILGGGGAAKPAAPAAGGAFSSSGPVDISSITRVATDDVGLKDQPAEPKFKLALAQIKVRSQKFDGIIVRCNPGQIKDDGGDQGKFDNAMRELRK